MTELDRVCILIVESDVLIRNLISTLLSNEGHLVLAAADHAETLELSRTFAGEIRLLVCRSNELARLIAGDRKTIRVVLLSPSTLAAMKEMARKVAPGAFVRQAAFPQKLGDSIRLALTDPNFGSAFVEA